MKYNFSELITTIQIIQVMAIQDEQPLPKSVHFIRYLILTKPESRSSLLNMSDLAELLIVKNSIVTLAVVPCERVLTSAKLSQKSHRYLTNLFIWAQVYLVLKCTWCLGH